jgi:hypothetical protein
VVVVNVPKHQPRHARHEKQPGDTKRETDNAQWGREGATVPGAPCINCVGRQIANKYNIYCAKKKGGRGSRVLKVRIYTNGFRHGKFFYKKVANRFDWKYYLSLKWDEQ